MRLISSIWLATSIAGCIFALTSNVQAATRPHYGGALRISVSSTITSLDPADPTNLSNANPSAEKLMQNIAPLLYDTLTTIDQHGEVQPSLALTWKSSSNATHWELQLRDGIKFSDGTPVTIGNVAMSLHTANPQWAISYTDSITIVTAQPDSELPAELSLVRNSILLRDNAKLLGTGPFEVTQWNAGKTLSLKVREDYWGTRAFLDAVEITFGRSSREQTLALELGRADVVELAPEQTNHLTAGNSALTSEPDVLLALVFNRDTGSISDQESRLRRALNLSIDRATLNNVVLQGTAEPAGGLLPNWMTGYEFVFPSSLDLEHARQQRAGSAQSAPWRLSYDAADSVSRVIAERLALNAQDAGLDVRPTSGSGDVRLVRIPLASRDARLALSQLAATVGLPIPAFHGGSAEELYAAENALLQSQQIIPLLHLRQAVGIARNVYGWSEDGDGFWNLPDVWLGIEK